MPSVSWPTAAVLIASIAAAATCVLTGHSDMGAAGALVGTVLAALMPGLFGGKQ